MKIIYRISDADNKKKRPSWFSKEKCLVNCIKEFPLNDNEWTIIADSIGKETKMFIENLVDSSVELIMLDVNSNSKAFNFLLDKILKIEAKSKISLSIEDEIVYVVEDDYMHLNGSQEAIREAFSLNCDYCTLYDHPDNKVISEVNKDWVKIETTTATFAANVKKIKEDINIFRQLSKRSTYDFWIWKKLTTTGRMLFAPKKGFSTHCLNGYLSKGIDWKKI